MKALVWLLALCGLLAAGEAEHRGGSFNGSFAYLDECVYGFVEHDSWPKRGVLAGMGHCDHYTDNSYDLFERSFTMVGGLGIYSTNLYRDSLFLKAMLGVEAALLETLESDLEGQRVSLKPMLVLGYQWQFRRGFLLAAGVGAQLRVPLWQQDTIAAGDASTHAARLKEALNVPTFAFKPTLVLGWRF